MKGALIVRPRPEQHVVDLAYNADGTPRELVAAARAAGYAVVVDGLDVLLAQGAASFERCDRRRSPPCAQLLSA